MGCIYFFEEDVPQFLCNDVKRTCRVEVLDNHGIPEIHLSLEKFEHDKVMLRFDNWSQFEKFFNSISAVHKRLSHVNNG